MQSHVAGETPETGAKGDKEAATADDGLEALAPQGPEVPKDEDKADITDVNTEAAEISKDQDRIEDMDLKKEDMGGTGGGGAYGTGTS
jgi:hypothetical protein